MSLPLIICGPTSTGKTRLALQLTDTLPFEIISADSRQVYEGMDIITGKDIPSDFHPQNSSLIWHGRYIKYFTNGRTRIWLTDVVKPDEQFNLSFFHELAFTIIPDILSRQKIPLIVGATGLYIKSLITPLSAIHAPQNPELRSQAVNLTANQLFDRLRRLDGSKAASLNTSDRHNPLRLIRAIEVAQSRPLPEIATLPAYHLLQLTAPREFAYQQIDKRVLDRFHAGARQEVERLLKAGYGWDLPSMHTSGYRVFSPLIAGTQTTAETISLWQAAEHRDFRQQEVWYRKQAYQHILDVTTPDWLKTAQRTVLNWYN